MRFAPVVLLPALLSAADLKIDHVTIAGSDLKALQAGLERVGIATTYGGAHANGVTEMALVSFPDGSYLEAIALQPKADPKAALSAPKKPIVTSSRFEFSRPILWRKTISTDKRAQITTNVYL